MVKPGSLESLSEYFRKSETTSEQWRIGLEHELLGYHIGTNKRVDYPVVRKVLDQFVQQFKWNPIYEGEYLIAAAKEGSTLTLEPGGQLELSTRPCKRIYDIQRLIFQFQEELVEISKEEKLFWLSIGYDPWTKLEDMPWMPKARYKVMKEYLPPLGDRVFYMMQGSCGAQSNYDYFSEEDMHKKMLVTTALAPVVGILFATSPIRESELQDVFSVRRWAWRGIDPRRVGMIQAVFREKFTYQDYVNYMLDVPMMVLQRGGKILDMRGLSFRDFWQGDTDVKPEVEDWATHLSVTFPVARLKNAIETRTADAGPIGMLLAQSAFWKGLLYSEEALNEAVDMIRNVGPDAWIGLHSSPPDLTLSAKVGCRTLKDWLESIVRVAEKGLKRLDTRSGLGEVEFLCPLIDVLDRGYVLSEYIAKEAKLTNTQSDLDFFEKIYCRFA